MGDRTSIRILNSRFERRSSGLLTTSFAASEGENQEENFRKSVLYGELFRSAEIPPTIRSTRDAESESFRRLAFSAFSATTYGDAPSRESSLPIARPAL